MVIQILHDPATFTLTYLVFDPSTRDAFVVDPVLDYDPLSLSTSTGSVERIDGFLRREGLKLHFVLETHPHSDHLSGSQYLKRSQGARVAIGENVTAVQRVFAEILDLEPSFVPDGSQFDLLLGDGDRIAAGSIDIEVIATPGHTPACLTYKVRDAIFTGDALFVEHHGTGRCDLPHGSADALYTSVHERLYALPDATRVFVGHDCGQNGRLPRSETTIGRSKAANVQLRADTSREEFVARRRERDATLQAPRLLFPSVLVNINGGRLPRPHANGRRYLTVPLNFAHATDDDGTPSERGGRPGRRYDNCV